MQTSHVQDVERVSVEREWPLPHELAGHHELGTACGLHILRGQVAQLRLCALHIKAVAGDVSYNLCMTHDVPEYVMGLPRKWCSVCLPA